MAWVDDRFWTHPKIVPLSYKAKWVCLSAILYSHGYGLYGRLTKQHQRAVGSDARIKKELVLAGLWEPSADDILIHDWDEHNGERDRKLEARREADRERKRRERAKKDELSRGQSRDSHADRPQDVTPHVTPMSSRAGGGARAGLTSDEVNLGGVTKGPDAEHEWPDEPIVDDEPRTNPTGTSRQIPTPELRGIA